MGSKLIFFSVFIFSALTTSAAAHFPTILDESAMKNGSDGRENISPCDDFYHFACGTWIDETTIPSDRKSVYRQSTPLDDATDANLNKILEAYAKGDFSLSSRYAVKLSDFYSSCMNVEKNSEASLQFMKKQIVRIQKPRNKKKEQSELLARLNLAGTGALFNFYSAQSMTDSSQVIGDLAQGGYGLGERDYYFDTDEKAVEIRQKYQAYIGQIFSLLGSSPSAAKNISNKILALEVKMAEKAYIDADASDPSKINHPHTREQLQKLMPHFDWNTYLLNIGLSKLQTVNVDEPEFFQNLDRVLSQISPADLNNYLTFHMVNSFASKLGGSFEQAHFQFWNAYMNGAKEMKPRWKTCTQAVENSMGYALAEAYVQTFNGAAIKQKTSSMISQIKSTFAQDLQSLSTGPEAWLDQDTMSGAMNKIDLMSEKVGAPQVWRNYDSVQTSDNYLDNSLRLTRFETLRDLSKIGKAVDKTEWGMMPWEVNAYYDPSNNEFVFPFGILQPPSLDLAASDGANLGSFGGGTIGHELTHGFDNSGRQFDAHGNLKSWWSPQTEKLFTQKSQCFVEQANAFTIKEVGLKVDGAQTLEENLADQGGVKLGYLALEALLKTRPAAAPWQGKYSERQQYWIAYAQSWCAKVTPEALRSQMTTDPHPPSEFRVNAVMMNRPEFARDFNCPVNSPMAPEKQCSIW